MGRNTAVIAGIGLCAALAAVISGGDVLGKRSPDTWLVVLHAGLLYVLLGVSSLGLHEDRIWAIAGVPLAAVIGTVVVSVLLGWLASPSLVDRTFVIERSSVILALSPIPVGYALGRWDRDTRSERPAAVDVCAVLLTVVVWYGSYRLYLYPRSVGEHTGVNPSFVFMMFVLLLAAATAGAIPAYVLAGPGARSRRESDA